MHYSGISISVPPADPIFAIGADGTLWPDHGQIHLERLIAQNTTRSVRQMAIVLEYLAARSRWQEIYDVWGWLLVEHGPQFVRELWATRSQSIYGVEQPLPMLLAELVERTPPQYRERRGYGVPLSLGGQEAEMRSRKEREAFVASYVEGLEGR